MAEIASIADVYDALASERPYRGALAPEKVVEIMRGMAGTSLNRELFDVFLSSVPVFPVGMTVRVTSGGRRGYRGVIARVNRHALDRPVVRVIRDFADQRITPFEIDLSKEEDVQIESVL
jgi:HD-GYP domain-containing protein (c-di-GMP phosphodiesterase class II)